MRKTWILFLLIFISTSTFAYNISDVNNLDILGIQKKREFSKSLNYKLTGDKIEHIGDLLTYLNDRYVYAIISFDTGRGIPASSKISTYLLRNDLSYDKSSYSSNYYTDYGNKIEDLLTTSQQIPCMKIDYQSALMPKSIIDVIVAEWTLGLNKAYSCYKNSKKHKKMVSDNEHIIDKSLQFFSVPMNRVWKQAILSYISLRSEWKSFHEGTRIFLSKAEMSQAVSANDLKKIESKTINNKTDLIYWDEKLRERLFDIPLQQLFILVNLKIDAAKGYLNDDEKKIMDVAKLFFSNSTRLIKYTTKQSTRDLYTATTKRIKKELDDNEYNELKSESQIALDWLRTPENINLEKP